MAPASGVLCESMSPIHMQIPLVEMASIELEKMRQRVKRGGDGCCKHSFPPACLALLKSIPGNSRCIDCGEHDPQWATVSFGALLCLSCSGRHRSLGVQVSCVRSITMDSWSQQEVLAMLEGGNMQLHNFFDRHALCEETQVDDVTQRSVRGTLIKNNVINLRYKTKAAEFYRKQMRFHVAQIVKSGEYKGREVSRRDKYRSMGERNSTVI